MAGLLLCASASSQTAAPTASPNGGPSRIFVAPQDPPLAAPATLPVLELNIHNEIEPVLAEYLTQAIDGATPAQYSLILITMDTPGGLDTSMRAIIQSIEHSRVPVVTFVYPSGSRAASAGFFILLSADVAAMAPGTDTGAASPLVEFGGTPVQIDDTLRHKIVNEAAAYLRSITTKRGRNPDLAEQAVTKATAFTDGEAISGKLVELSAQSPEDLVRKLDGRTITRFDGSPAILHLASAVIETRQMTGRQQFLSRIVQPDVFFVLLIIGILGLYAEFTHPGMFAPGVLGAIALVLALFAMHLLPVNLTGLILILLALVLFVLEAKFPTHGVLGVGGVVAMILGALMLVRSPLTGMGVSLGTAVGIALPVALIIIFLMRLVLRSRNWKQSTGREQLVGEIGDVLEAIAAGGRGMILVHGERWQAVSTQDIPQGARVRVRRIAGLTLTVEPMDMPSAASMKIASS
jgi:membrane-bound serine protease (ClpP class)